MKWKEIVSLEKYYRLMGLEQQNTALLRLLKNGEGAQKQGRYVVCIVATRLQT